MTTALTTNHAALYQDQSKITLAACLGAGREGTVHRLAHTPGTAAKLLLPHSPDPAGTAAKLTLMLHNPPPQPATRRYLIAWPTALITSPKNKPRAVGYTMPLLPPERYHQIGTYFNPLRRRRLLNSRSDPYTYLHLLTIARNLATAVAHLHQHGAVVGDINSKNILATDSCRVAVIDTDSFQITDHSTGRVHRSRVGTPEYTPPRLQGLDFATIDRTPSDDLFALAVLIYQLLLQGAHPHAGAPTGSAAAPDTGNIALRIAEGLYIHDPKNTAAATPAHTTTIWQDLPLKKHFTASFQRPHARTSARTWVRALDEAITKLRHCRTNPAHLHFTRSCTWCRYRSIVPVAPFPRPGEAPTRNLRSKKKK